MNEATFICGGSQKLRRLLYCCCAIAVPIDPDVHRHDQDQTAVLVILDFDATPWIYGS